MWSFFPAAGDAIQSVYDFSHFLADVIVFGFATAQSAPIEPGEGERGSVCSVKAKQESLTDDIFCCMTDSHLYKLYNIFAGITSLNLSKPQSLLNVATRLIVGSQSVSHVYLHLGLSALASCSQRIQF